jgi:hypothetical protein
MAKQEGIRRIVMTGKLIVLIGIVLGVLYVVTITMFARGGGFLYPGVVGGVSIALQIAALGGLVWAAGWIADGFAGPDA